MLVVNGTDLGGATYGVIGRSRELPRLGGERSVVTDIPGSVFPRRMGGAYVSDRLAFHGYVRGTSHADLQTKLDAIAGVLNALPSSPLSIRPSDVTAREWQGYLQQGGRALEIAPQWLQRIAELSIEFQVLGPARDVVELTSTSGGINLLTAGIGTAPNPFRITVTNAATSTITRVVVRVRDGGAAGTIKRTLQWDGVVALSQALVIDSETFSVTNNGANAIGGLTSASEFPIADPREGDDYLEIAVTGGTGRTLQTRWRRRYF
ncbi:MAG TPA: hypothetical protein VD838_21130 [Anaeromyxobacteraceae bacterium]|nr:hypothetical protein [Anaeromyxobacteraceae bacterium]